MNRTALCFKMLKILNAHTFVTKEELANRLETNPRNIAEFKREIEIAGYEIESIKGRYGGYYLAKNALFPTTRLSLAEMNAFNEGYEYLKNHPDFLDLAQFREAYEKIKMSITFNKPDTPIIFKNTALQLEEPIKEMIDRADKAIINNVSISFDYQSLRSTEFKNVELQPYQVINVRGEYYVLGYNPERRSFRTYKFSNLRMKNLRVSNHKFTRDIDFNINAYIGSSNLMKEESYEVECVFSGDYAVLVYEQGIGVNPAMEWTENRELKVVTLMEGKMRTIQELISYGSACRVIAPLEIKEAIRDEARKMCALNE